MSIHKRLETLKVKHRACEVELAEAMSHPSASDYEILEIDIENSISGTRLPTSRQISQWQLREALARITLPRSDSMVVEAMSNVPRS